MPTELDAVSGLLVWGPLGVFCVLAALTIRALFKHMAAREQAHREELTAREEAHRTEQVRREDAFNSVITKITETHRTELVALADRQRAEMVALAERHLAATNTWTQHYQVWAERATAVLEALYRRADRR